MKSFAIALWVLGTLLQSSSGSTQTQEVFENASKALKAGDYDGAEAGFRNVLKTDPQNIGALGNLGVVYSRTHCYARAIDVYKHALRLTPQDPGLLLDLGLVYFKQDAYARALPIFRRLHARDPSNTQVTDLLATCLVHGGQPKAALMLLKSLADKKPDPGTVYLLGVAYAKSGQVEAGQQAFAKLFSSAGTQAQTSFLRSARPTSTPTVSWKRSRPMRTSCAPIRRSLVCIASFGKNLHRFEARRGGREGTAPGHATGSPG